MTVDQALKAPAGIDVGFAGGRPRVGRGISVFEQAARPLGAMQQVTATPVPRGSRRIQYWMVNGIVGDSDAAGADPKLCYDFTFMLDRPIGWERPKTLGHTHPRPGPGKMGFAEVVEVVRGSLGMIVQDLLPGPRCSAAWLVVGNPGDRIILPPFLAHASINLAGNPAVFSDVIDRRIVAGDLPSDYTRVAEARGFAYYFDLDGDARPNPAYVEVPPLVRLTAAEWSGPGPHAPLYRDYVDSPEQFDWIVDPELFPARFPELWARVRDAATRMSEL